MPQNIAWFNQVDRDDLKLVGGKGVSMGEMSNAGFPIPKGFIVTTNAYYEFIKRNNIDAKISNLTSSINFNDPHSLKQVSDIIRKEVIEGEMSSTLSLEIYSAYKNLGQDVFTAIRSSTTVSNNLLGIQNEAFLNVKGDTNVLIYIKKCWASLFNEESMLFRYENKFDHKTINLAVIVQKMIESEKSGSMFTIDPESNNKDRLIIEAIYGLGELKIQETVHPDHYEVSKLADKILIKEIAPQNKMLKKSGNSNKIVKVSIFAKKKQKLSDIQILELAKLGKKLEKHYFFPQNAQWAIENGKIYIIESRQITTINNNHPEISSEKNAKFDKPLLSGYGLNSGIVTGHVRIIKNSRELTKLIRDEILVTNQTNSDFIQAMKKAKGVITNSGNKTSHTALISREIGIPMIIGTEKATATLKDGMVVTINSRTGEIFKGGFVSKSSNSHEQSEVDEDIKTATKIYMNLDNPDSALRNAKIKSDGIGLLSAELMMKNMGNHPKKMIRDGNKKEYIKDLANGIEQFCSAMYPRPVIYRASNFKTSDYRSLEGGKEFEPIEPNPMIGFRGTYRYIRDPEVFNLELEAIKYVRDKKNLKNLWLMLPFTRTPKELEEIKKVIIKAGLQRSPSFKLWMMVEIPSNVILLEKFIDVGIDGITIEIDNLATLILGTDRSNSEVASEFDVKNEAVLWAIEKTIATAGKLGITSSICGQSTAYPEILETAIKAGVTIISVSPNLVQSTKKQVSELEENIFKL